MEEDLTSQLAALNLGAKHTNLKFRGTDPHFSDLPPFLKQHNDFYFIGQDLVKRAISTYSSLIGHEAAQTAIYDYRRSYASGVKAEEFFMRYDVEYHEIVKDEIYHNALDLVTEWFRPSGVIHPVHMTDLRWYPWNLSTSAERPFTTDKDLKALVLEYKHKGLIDNAKMSFGNCINTVFEYNRKYIHNIKHGMNPGLHHIQLHVKPAIVDSAEPDKVRSVYGCPKSLIFSEAMFLWPLFSNYFSNQTSPLLWNYETLKGGWLRLNDEYLTMYSQYRPVISFDWSEFDMRLYFTMWSDIREKVATYFCWCGRYHPTRTYPCAQTNPQKLKLLWNWTEHAYFDSLAVTTTGKLYQRMFAGMPSGIFGTQFYDSFYNAVMVVTTLASIGYEISPTHFLKTMGDDVISGLLKHIPEEDWPHFLQAFENEAKRRFNSSLNKKKSRITETIQGSTILSYDNWNGWPSRDLTKLLAQLLHPKSMRDTPPRLMARAIGIYYASAGDYRMRPICEYIFSELASQGYSPNPKGLNELFNPETSVYLEIDPTRFPSRTEVVSRLMSPSQRSQVIQDKYWHIPHFLVEAGANLHL
nr:MAG: putative RNA-dependent RNA polymerase [Partitiviridae sp.]